MNTLNRLARILQDALGIPAQPTPVPVRATRPASQDPRALPRR